MSNKIAIIGLGYVGFNIVQWQILNKLYAPINEELKNHIDNFSSKETIYRDFRAGDIRHSNANITKSQNICRVYSN